MLSVLLPLKLNQITFALTVDEGWDIKNQAIIKRHSTEWNTIFAQNISDKGLVSRIYKELIKHKKRPISPFINRPRLLATLFPKKAYGWTTVKRQCVQHSRLGKCKSKQQWDIISFLWEWNLSKTGNSVSRVVIFIIFWQIIPKNKITTSHSIPFVFSSFPSLCFCCCNDQQ